MHIYYWVAIAVVVLNIIFSLSLIFIERKDPTTTWAWLLILLVLPGVGFVLYLMFGQNLSRQKIFKDKIISDEKKRMASNQDEKLFSKHSGGDKFSDLQRMNFNNSGSKYTVNNAVDVYVNGEDKFKQLIEDIKNAKSYIHVEYYIFKKDIIGKRIIDELTKKAKEGLEVRLLVDAMGSRSLTKKTLKHYIEAGGKFSLFFPGILPHVNTRINYRNHRKIVVIDGVYGYVGGFNVGKEYINQDPEFGFWRDTHVRIKGDAVNDLNERFLLDWCYASEENIKDFDKYMNECKDQCGDVSMQIVTSGPDHKEEYIKNVYIKIINNAKKNV
ncbi:cardiolipin synthase, partial [Clostridium butyricum]|uniref:cardiolipin synthase n=1 Tax=Clostridium butyricum TaxID=1492 RepID=UPI003D353D17